MNFEECLMECASQPELVQQFNRLTGSNLGEKRSPIDIMVDNATGYENIVAAQQNEQCARFVEFVYNCVWLRLAPVAGAVQPASR